MTMSCKPLMIGSPDTAVIDVCRNDAILATYGSCGHWCRRVTMSSPCCRCRAFPASLPCFICEKGGKGIMREVNSIDEARVL